jgi:hypothetical protein
MGGRNIVAVAQKESPPPGGLLFQVLDQRHDVAFAVLWKSSGEVPPMKERRTKGTEIDGSDGRRA